MSIKAESGAHSTKRPSSFEEEDAADNAWSVRAALEKRYEMRLAECLRARGCGRQHGRNCGMIYLYMYVKVMVESIPEFIVHRCADYLLGNSAELYKNGKDW